MMVMMLSFCAKCNRLAVYRPDFVCRVCELDVTVSVRWATARPSLSTAQTPQSLSEESIPSGGLTWRLKI